MKLPKLMLLTGAAVSSAVAQSYFPLDAGNSWLYRLQGNPILTDQYRSISVEGRDVVNGVEYFRVRYFTSVLLLRADSSGTIVSYDRQSETDRPWLAPGLPDGAHFNTSMDSCTTIGRVVSHTASVATPAGRFSNALQVSYSGPCADAGTTQQVYVPGVGLAVHEETSFAGPRRYELVHSNLGPKQPELSFTIALDGARYAPGAEMGVRLTLRNTTPDPVTLVFPSGQDYDLKIVNDKGDTVYTWSAGRAFAMIYREEKLGPGERNWGITAPLAGLPPGHYRAQACLATSPAQYIGETAFEIVPAAEPAMKAGGQAR